MPGVITAEVKIDVPAPSPTLTVGNLEIGTFYLTDAFGDLWLKRSNSVSLCLRRFETYDVPPGRKVLQVFSKITITAE